MVGVLACMMFVSATFDAIKMTAILTRGDLLKAGSNEQIEAKLQRAVGICSPGSVTYAQMTDIVGRYLSENPQIRHLSATFLAWQELQAAFPCQK